MRKTEKGRNEAARKTIKIMQAHYSEMIKHCDGGKGQFNHKPYQCDIELK